VKPHPCADPDVLDDVADPEVHSHPERHGVIEELSANCEECGLPGHFMLPGSDPRYDHAPCFRKGLQRASEKLGRMLATRRNQAILDIILAA
jgi:hypothetical protein